MTSLSKTITEFGAQAAAGMDLDELLQFACDQVANGLRVSHAKVLEYLTDERELLLRAGHGWSEGVVGSARLGAELASPAGFTLQTGKPTIANDLQHEERFTVPTILAEHGVRSACNVIIKSGDHLFGVLEADSRDPRDFDEQDLRSLQSFANIIALAVAQKRLADRNFELSEQLTVLLQELEHRTRNNNQMLLSLLSLEKSRHTMLEVRQVIDDITGRVRILTSMYDLMRVSEGVGEIDLGKYVLAVAQNAFTINKDRTARVKLAGDLADVSVSSRTAQSVGMIVNEFLTNSFKYGIADRDGEIEIALSRQDQLVRLMLRDDGPGFDMTQQADGLGIKIIESAAKQLGATAEWNTTRGTRLELSLHVVSKPRVSPAQGEHAADRNRHDLDARRRSS